MEKIKNILSGPSADSIFLTFIRLVTLVFGLLMTRMLSGHFSVYDYGTYSQVILLVTTVSTLTILGMMDGINFFFSKERDVEKREKYVNTIFFLQWAISAIVAIVVLVCTIPISLYFDNADLKKLIGFVAILPVLQNSISLLQIIFIALGKSKIIAIRNLILSILKLLTIVLACYIFDNIVLILFFQLITDIIQVWYFYKILKKNGCTIHILKADKSLFKEIFSYCIPMAMFTVIKTLNRDCDKFIISAFTDTETLAIYTNASKLLPFDIIMTSFTTVLLPYFTRYIADKKYELSQKMFKSFLELSYITTTILAFGAVCVAPELMRFLYTEKYLSGVSVFIIYLLVDIFSIFNITMLLSAAGKTKTIMFVSFGVFISNIFLNIGFYHIFGIKGPALATLVVTIMQGIVLLSFSCNTLQTKISKIFELKYVIRFLLGIIVFGGMVYYLRKWLVGSNCPYIIVLMLVYGIFVCLMALMNIKRLKKCISDINSYKL